MMFMMLIGLPGSGKSTYARKIFDDDSKYGVVVSSDAIRKELYGSEEVQDNPQKVFDFMRKRTVEALECGKSVVYDATNLTYKHRVYVLNQLKHKFGDSIHYLAVVMATPYAECVKRQEFRERQVPERVIKRMVQQFDVPLMNEGWDSIELSYSDNARIANFDDFMANFPDMPQHNPNHHLGVNSHMAKAEEIVRQSGVKGDNDRSKVLLEAVRMHDIGKPFTQTIDGNGIGHYYNHENVGSYNSLFISTNCKENVTENILRRASLIRWHMSLYEYRVMSAKKVAFYNGLFGDDLISDLRLLNQGDRGAGKNND